MDFEARRTEIEKRGREIDARLIEIAAARREHSLAATEGDKTASRTIEKLDAEAAALAREAATLVVATEQIAGLEAEARIEIAARAREREIVEARKLAAATVKLNGEIDAAMTALCRLFERRSGLLRELGSTGAFPAPYLLRLAQKFAPTCAARKAGLGDFLSLDHVPPGHVTSLVESNSGLAKPIVAVEREPPTPRYQPRENNDAANFV